MMSNVFHITGHNALHFILDLMLAWVILQFHFPIIVEVFQAVIAGLSDTTQ